VGVVGGLGMQEDVLLGRRISRGWRPGDGESAGWGPGGGWGRLSRRKGAPAACNIQLWLDQVCVGIARAGQVKTGRRTGRLCPAKRRTDTSAEGLVGEPINGAENHT